MEEDDYEDAPVEALSGNIQSMGDTSEMGTVILMLTGELTKLEILLGEVDEDEFRKLSPRLGRLLGVLARIPRPRALRRLGFQMPSKERRQISRTGSRPKGRRRKT